MKLVRLTSDYELTPFDCGDEQLIYRPYLSMKRMDLFTSLKKMRTNIHV